MSYNSGMKKHWPLAVGIGVPVVFLLGVIAFALMPRLGPKPSHDILLWGTGDRYYDSPRCSLEVEKGKVVVDGSEPYGAPTPSLARADVPCQPPVIYRYGVGDRSLREISLEDAQKLSVDAGPTSDDGFVVGGPVYRGDLLDLFGGGRDERLGIYRDGRKVDEVVLPQDRYYYGGPNFLAWID